MDVVALVNVPGKEPMIINADNTAVWLSCHGTHGYAVSLIPENLKDSNIQSISDVQSFIEGGKTKLIYSIFHKVAT